MDCLKPCPAHENLPAPGPIPEGVWNLLNLEWLNATENALSGSMSPAMSNLTQLVELNLSSNRLSGCLPREVCTMRALTTLQLSHNALTGSLPIEVRGAACSLCCRGGKCGGSPVHLNTTPNTARLMLS